MDRAEIGAAVADFLSAALLGDGWEEAIERLGTASGGCAATMLRLVNGRGIAGVSSPGWRSADAELLAGRAPPSSRQFFPDHALTRGFCVDADLYTHEELSRDPYYQEFLRPRGAFWHAKARLIDDGGGERISLSLKRSLEAGPYQRDDVAVLNAVLGDLAAAARIGRRMLDAKAAGILQVLQNRGDAAFELDSWGCVRRVHTGDPEAHGLQIKGRRLVATDRLSQSSLDRAVGKALLPPQRSATAVIAGSQGERKLLQVVPVLGRARDVFGTTAAIVIVIEPAPRPGFVRLDPLALRDGFGLTDREAQVAVRLAQGSSLADVARDLSLQRGTARNHLKSIFEKTGTSRQGQLVALLCKLCS